MAPAAAADLPRYLRDFQRKEAWLDPEMAAEVDRIARALDRYRQQTRRLAGQDREGEREERITANTLIRLSVRLLLESGYAEALSGRDEEELWASLQEAAGLAEK